MASPLAPPRDLTELHANLPAPHQNPLADPYV